MLGRKTVLTLTILGVFGTLIPGVGSGAETSACKGLEQTACEKKSDCAWVAPYTRKDGNKVSGYCRTKTAKKTGSGAAATPTSGKKKDDKK